jgi:hypothetical protein
VRPPLGDENLDLAQSLPNIGHTKVPKVSGVIEIEVYRSHKIVRFMWCSSFFTQLFGKRIFF